MHLGNTTTIIWNNNLNHKQFYTGGVQLQARHVSCAEVKCCQSGFQDADVVPLDRVSRRPGKSRSRQGNVVLEHDMPFLFFAWP